MDYNVIKLEFCNHDFELITKKEDYKNAKQRLEYTCNKHPEEGIQFINYDNLKQGNIGCKGCSLEQNIEKAKKYYSKLCEEKDMQLIDIKRNFNEKYIIYYICNKHKAEGINNISASNLSRGQGCNFCGRIVRGLQERIPLEKVSQEFVNKGYTIVDDLEKVY